MIATTMSDTITEVSRTPDFISILIDVSDVYVLRINICLRLYRTISEVLHSFDVDTNCVGYDGVDVWCTKRCEYAMLGGFNTLNFDLF